MQLIVGKSLTLIDPARGGFCPNAWLQQLGEGPRFLKGQMNNERR